VNCAAAGIAITAAVTLAVSVVSKVVRMSVLRSVGCEWTQPAGEYQIGELQARSCCRIGTSVDILTPKRDWTYAV